MAVKVGDRCEGQYRGDWYGGTVQEISSDSVTVEWDPPHNQWGPMTLPSKQVREAKTTEQEKEVMETIEKQRKEQEAVAEHPLLQFLPGALFDMKEAKVDTIKHLTGCGVVAVLLVRVADPLTDMLAQRCKELCDSLAARGAKAPAFVVFPLDELVGGKAATQEQWAAFRASVPSSWLSVNYDNAPYIADACDILIKCQIRSESDFPTLSIFSESGALINAAGSWALASDPKGVRFPWGRGWSYWLRTLAVPAAGVGLAYLAYQYLYAPTAGSSSSGSK